MSRAALLQSSGVPWPSLRAGLLLQRRACAAASTPPSICCLLPKATGAQRDSGTSCAGECAVRDASWQLFAKIRRGARSDPSFAGCELHVARHLYSWRPEELVTLCGALARSASPAASQALGRVLWQAERLVESLPVRAVVRLLEAYAARCIREHDPGRPDLFRAAAPHLAARVDALGAAEINRVSAMYRQLNLREVELFEALATRLVGLLEGGASASTAAAAPETPPRRPRRLPGGDGSGGASSREDGGTETAAMGVLVACGRLNIAPSRAHRLLELVGPRARAARDLGRLTALAQLSAKFGFSGQGEVDAVYHTIGACLEAQQQGVNDAVATSNQAALVPRRASSPRVPLRGFASQVAFGQLLLALVFDEAPSKTRDLALAKAVGAVWWAFGATPKALDERLARQLQVAGLACRLERPGAEQLLVERGLAPFLEDLCNSEQARAEAAGGGFAPTASSLSKASSQQHMQVSGALQELGMNHRLEEVLLPYVADVRMRGGRRLIEVDGPLHFVGQSHVYDLKSSLKHRLLTKQGWEVHHIAWNDWPVQRHSRLNYLARLLRSAPPGHVLREYRPLDIVSVSGAPAASVAEPAAAPSGVSAASGSAAEALI